MWIFSVLFPSFVLVGSTCIAVVCGERRPIVLLSIGGMVGLVATGIVLSWLALLFGIAVATWLTFILLTSGGLAAAVYWWRSRLLKDETEVSWKYVVLTLVLAAHFGLVAAVSWQSAVGAGGVPDSLYAHSAFAASISRGNFPVVNPYQPDQLLTYRLTYHLLGAFVIRLTGQPAPEVLAWLTGVLFVFLFLGANGMGRAARLGSWRTLLAAVLFLTVSRAQWAHLPQLVSLENLRYNHHVLVSDYLPGALGPALSTKVQNVSLSYGFLVMLCVVTFYLYTWRAVGTRRTFLAVATGVALGHLLAAAESWFAALAAALVVDIVGRYLFSRKLTYANLSRLAAAAIALIVTAFTSPGILMARLLNGAGGSLELQFKGDRLLYMQLGTYGDEVWVSLFEIYSVWTMIGVLFMLLWILYYLWRTRDHLTGLFLLFSGACFSAVLLFTVGYGADMGRFLHAGTSSFGFVAAMVVVWTYSRLHAASPLLRQAALAVISGATLACTVGFISYSLALPWLADPRPPVTHRLDVEAVKAFLNSNIDVQERLLVLGGADRWSSHPSYELDHDRRLLSAYVAAYSGQFYPTGTLFADRLGHSYDSPQIRQAAAAQGKLSALELQALDITYLYASEPWLNDIQRAALAEKLERGSLARVWQAADAGPPRSCRAFVRVANSPDAPITALSFDDDEKNALPGSPLQLEVPSLSQVMASSGRSGASGGRVQATLLIASSESTEVHVDNGAGFSLRPRVEQAVAIRTPPLDPGTILTIRTESGTASVLWIEVYAPVAPDSSVFLPEDLVLCS